jgi:hypothetical protein
MINPKNFRSKKRESRLHVKIRLVKRGRQPTREETLDAIDFILETGHAPDRWEFHVIDWAHPTSSGSGGESDMQAFRHLIEEMRDDMLIAPVAE